MPRIRLIGVASLIIASGFWSGRAEGDASPLLRHKAYVILAEPRPIQLTSIRCGGKAGPYTDVMSYRIVNGRNEMLAEDDLALESHITWQPEGDCHPLMVALEPHQNYATIECAAPFGLVAGRAAPLHIVRKSGRLYFALSHNAKSGRLVIAASAPREGAHVVVREGEGKTCAEADGDFDRATDVPFNIPATQAGRVWSVEVSEPKIAGLVLDDVTIWLEGDLTPVLTMREEWAQLLANSLVETPAVTPPRARRAESPMVLRRPDELAARRPVTRAPAYYLLDYGSDHLDNPDYVQWVAQFPPDLLHFGKDVPMTHLWGPIVAVGGENQAHGRNRADIRRLTSDEVQQRLDKLRTMNKALHAAGVRMVMPYISAITFAGDAEKRIGLFEFYDHWGEYTRFGLGPKPATDPLAWIAVKADGSPHTFGAELRPAYYAGLSRYVACVNHPDWRQWLGDVTQLVAKAGYDGAFADNSSPIQCYSSHCQAAFREYLAGKYSVQERIELFGAPEAPLPATREGLLYYEAQRFWQLSLADELRGIRQAGREINPDFKLFPNLGTPYQSYDFLTDNADCAMFEGSGGGSMADSTGSVTWTVIGPFKERSYCYHMSEYRYCAGVPGDLAPMLLKRTRTKDGLKLSMAEAAAFGSGAANGLSRGTREWARTYLEFARAHPELYVGTVSAADVAVLSMPMHVYYPKTAHWAAAQEVMNRLLALRVPFDCISEGGMTAERLAAYRCVIAPKLQYLSDPQLAMLREYVREGGTLAALAPFATHDDRCRERKAAPLAEGPNGQGRVVLLAGTPTRGQLFQAVGGRLAEGPPGLRAMVYARSGNLSRYVVHLLNYDVNADPKSDERTAPARDVSVTLRLPDRVNVTDVTCFDPDSPKPERLPFDAHGAQIVFRVPEVPIYRVCLVEATEP
jgi:hypothetical protein